MPTLSLARVSSVAIAALSLTTGAIAAQPVKASCTVSVDYLLNGTLVEPYSRIFEVVEGTEFVDDFSTPTRSKLFSASAVRDGGKATVKMSYFNDVGVFQSIAVDTSVPIGKSGMTASSTGRHVFSTSVGVVGNHTTAYTLTCARI